ncbi:hypothetical protein E4T39_08837 [Aureobasidium subglaciale]|nr:hypothetical protein E4T39_08837 [Aureobasidium subglaciale]
MSSGTPTQEATNNTSASPTSRPKPSKLGQSKNNQLQKQQAPASDEESDQEDKPELAPKRAGGRRMVPVHQSRISDRPAKVGEKDSSLKIKIELDLEVEVEIYARVKGDVTIGLM